MRNPAASEEFLSHPGTKIVLILVRRGDKIFFKASDLKVKKLWRKCNVRIKCAYFQFLLQLTEGFFCCVSAFCEV